MRAACAIVLLLSPLVGCAVHTSAQLPQWQPAAASLDQIRTVAVAPLAGDKEWAPIAGKQIREQLAASGRYRLVDCPELVQPLSPTTDSVGHFQRLTAAQSAARHAGADALMVAKFHVGEGAPSAFGGIQMRVGETVTNARLQVDLIDTRTGNRLISDSVQHSFQGDYAGGTTSYNSEKQIKLRLTRKCVDEIVTSTITGETTIPVDLAGDVWSDADLKRGNALAAEGNWRDAIAAWQKCSEADPDNHAAIYNLGLGHEALGQYEMAQLHYRLAGKLDNRDNYTAALTRVEDIALQRAQASAPSLAQRPELARLPAF